MRWFVLSHATPRWHNAHVQMYTCNICEHTSQHIAVCPVKSPPAAQPSSVPSSSVIQTVSSSKVKTPPSSFNFRSVLGSTGAAGAKTVKSTGGIGGLAAGRDFVPLSGSPRPPPHISRTGQAHSFGVKRPADGRGNGGGGAVNLLELEKELKRQQKKRKSGEGGLAMTRPAAVVGGGLGSLQNLLNKPLNKPL